MRSRRPPDAGERPPDYSHRFHAGNVGDVWKHCVLVETLARVASSAGVVHYLDTHAGEGRYPLGPTGEWTEGIGRLWATAPGDVDALPAAVERFLTVCRRLAGDDVSPRRYPGSPAFAAAVLPERARLHLWEHEAAAAGRLGREIGNDPRITVTSADGLAALEPTLDAVVAGAGDVVVLIDPPYTAKAEWIEVPAALARAAWRFPRARFILWYPVKSLTRPNAMHALLERAGVAATIAELVTTPLELQRNRLNGSGVILVRPPAGVLPAIAAAAPILGARCATRPDAWSLRLRSWGAGRGDDATCRP